MAEAMVRILGGGWHEPQPARQQQPADEETAAWDAWAGVTDGYDRAARSGLPVFHAARVRDLVTVAGDLAEEKQQALLIADPAVAALAHAWELLAVAVQWLLADLQSLTGPQGRASRAEAAGAIEVYLRYFGGAAQPQQVADRLLKLALAERALLPADAEPDQPVEFVQFSANTRTLLAPADDSLPATQQLDSVTKLRGVELDL